MNSDRVLRWGTAMARGFLRTWPFGPWFSWHQPHASIDRDPLPRRPPSSGLDGGR
jgi:hypothetical protein